MKSETLTQKAYKAIKKSILHGEYEFGIYLDQKEVMKKYGFASITPIREALLQLQNDGLVEIIPRKGVCISRLSMEDVIDNFQIREIIEPTVFAVTMGKISKSVCEKYIKIFKDCVDNTQKCNILEYTEIDMDFHFDLLRPLENKNLNKILTNVYEENTRYRLVSLKMRDIASSANEHLNILNAIMKDEKEEAVAFLKEHIKNSKQAIIDHKNTF